MGIYLLNKKRGAINVKRGTRNDEKGVFKGLARAPTHFHRVNDFYFWPGKGSSEAHASLNCELCPALAYRQLLGKLPIVYSDNSQ